MNHRVPGIVVLAAGAAALLAACGPTSSSADGTSSAAAPSSAASAAASSVTSLAGAGSAAKTISVCAVLSAHEAATLSGQPYTRAQPEDTGGGSGSRCAYDNEDSTVEGVNVTVWTSDAANTWQTVHTGGVSDVSGLGDKAFWDNDNTLYVLSGTNLIQVNGLDSETRSESLAKPVLAALH